jgi:hypothetical protein
MAEPKEGWCAVRKSSTQVEKNTRGKKRKIDADLPLVEKEYALLLHKKRIYELPLQLLEMQLPSGKRIKNLINVKRALGPLPELVAFLYVLRERKSYPLLDFEVRVSPSYVYPSKWEPAREVFKITEIGQEMVLSTIRQLFRECCRYVSSSQVLSYRTIGPKVVFNLEWINCTRRDVRHRRLE